MSEIPRGAIRFNTDSNKPELWDGSQWAEFQLSTPNLGRGVDTEPGARGVFVTGYTASSPENVANSDYINIASTGNAQDFGNLAKALRYSAGCSSNTRGLTFSGYEGPAYSTTIYKTTIASTGSHASFGDVTPAARLGHSCWSSQTRAIMFSGSGPSGQDGKIKYVTITSEGNTVDFGDLSDGYNFRYGGSSGNRTRAIAMGGYQEPTAASVNTIQFVTISTLGDGQDFGDLTNIARDHNGSTSNGIKSVIHARDSGYTETQLDQLRPNTLGNSYSFGDLSAQRVFSPAHSCMSSPTRGIFGGGIISPGASSTDVIDYVLFATEGNAVDFGDMVGNSGNGYSAYSSFSNAHGGL